MTEKHVAVEGKKKKERERNNYTRALFPKCGIINYFSAARFYTAFKKRRWKREIPILYICIPIRDALSSGLCSNS